jgi:hypothetical protein
MISKGKELYRFIDTIMIPHGYVRKKDTWYLHSEECICFLSVGKL